MAITLSKVLYIYNIAREKIKKFDVSSLITGRKKGVKQRSGLYFSSLEYLGNPKLTRYHTELQTNRIWKQIVDKSLSIYSNGSKAITRKILMESFDNLIKVIQLQELKNVDPLLNCKIAWLVSEWNCSVDTIIAALYSDVPLDIAKKIVPPKAYSLLERKSLISKDEFLLKSDHYTDRKNCRNLLLSWEGSRDVHLIKAAYEYHILFNPNRGKDADRIAMHALYVTSVILKLLHLDEFAYNLEEIAFSKYKPSAFRRIDNLLYEIHRGETEENCAELTEDICCLISEHLDKFNIKNSIQNVRKRHFALWKNEKRKEGDFTRDANQMRIIVEMEDLEIRQWEEKNNISIWEFISGITFYTFLLHGWTMHPHLGIRDYISNPKKNNYQSYHMNFVKDFKRNFGIFPISVQIRSRAMHIEAQSGRAAHWRYKEKNIKGNSFDEEIKYLLRDGRIYVLVKIDNTEKITKLTPFRKKTKTRADVLPTVSDLAATTNIVHDWPEEVQVKRIDGRIDYLTCGRRLITGDTIIIDTTKNQKPSRNKFIQFQRHATTPWAIALYHFFINHGYNRAKDMVERNPKKLAKKGRSFFEKIKNEIIFPTLENMFSKAISSIGGIDEAKIAKIIPPASPKLINFVSRKNGLKSSHSFFIYLGFLKDYINPAYIQNIELIKQIINNYAVPSYILKTEHSATIYALFSSKSKRNIREKLRILFRNNRIRTKHSRIQSVGFGQLQLLIIEAEFLKKKQLVNALAGLND